MKYAGIQGQTPHHDAVLKENKVAIPDWNPLTFSIQWKPTQWAHYEHPNARSHSIKKPSPQSQHPKRNPDQIMIPFSIL